MLRPRDDSALAPYDGAPPDLPTVARRSMSLGAVLAGIGAVAGVVALLLSELPHLTPQGALIGAVFGAVLGSLYGVVSGIVRKLRPNADGGTEHTPAFLVAVVGAAVCVGVIWGQAVAWMVLVAFWFTLGIGVIAMLAHHEITQ